VWRGRTSEVRESTSVLIRRSPLDVWDYVSDLSKTPTWRTTVTSIAPPEDLQVGAQFEGTTRLLGRTWRWVLEVTEVDVGRKLGYVVVDGVVKLAVSYGIEPSPDGTEFTLTGGVVRYGLAGRLLKPLALPALRRETAVHLENLKRLLESR